MPSARLERRTTMSTEKLIEHEVPRDQWAPFFSSFSAAHKDWLVSVDVLKPASRDQVAHDAPLAGITLDGDRVVITVSRGSETQVARILEHPDSVVLALEPGGAEDCVTVRAGTTAVRVRFRSTLLPEMVDGVP